MSELWGIPRDSLTQEDGPGRWPPTSARCWPRTSRWASSPRSLVLLIKGDSSPFVRGHSVESLNFQISLLIYAVVLGIVAAVLVLVTVGVGLLIVIPVGLLLAVVVLVLIVHRHLPGQQRGGLRVPVHHPPREVTFTAAGRAPRRRPAAVRRG